jgi:hypothetical protein
MIPVNQRALQTMLDILYSGGEKATAIFPRVAICLAMSSAVSSAIRYSVHSLCPAPIAVHRNSGLFALGWVGSHSNSWSRGDCSLVPATTLVERGEYMVHPQRSGRKRRKCGHSGITIGTRIAIRDRTAAGSKSCAWWQLLAPQCFRRAVRLR